MFLCGQTVTLYHRDYDPEQRRDVWTRTSWPKASWYGARKAAVNDNGMVSMDTYTVRIDTAQTLTASPGDVLILGAVEDAVTGSTQLTSKYKGRCCIITHVQDNRRGAARAWHWRLEGR